MCIQQSCSAIPFHKNTSSPFAVHCRSRHCHRIVYYVLVQQFTNQHHLLGTAVSRYFLENSPTLSLPTPQPFIFLPSFPHCLFQTCHPNFFSTNCPVPPHVLTLHSRVPFPRIPGAALVSLRRSQPLPAAHAAAARTNCLSPKALICRSWLHR